MAEIINLQDRETLKAIGIDPEKIKAFDNIARFHSPSTLEGKEIAVLCPKCNGQIVTLWIRDTEIVAECIKYDCDGKIRMVME